MNTSGIPQLPLNSQIALEAAQWFVANREGPLPPAQARAFMQWLQASPQHVAEYLEVAAIAEYSPGATKQDPVDLDALLAKMGTQDKVVGLDAAEGRLAPAAPARRPVPARSSRRRFRWSAGLAAALMLATVTGVLTWSLQRPDVRSYATAHGQLGEWTLPDGTHLRLNSESAVTIRFDRSKRRVDVVHGQALFDVASESARPFEVRAGANLIEDVGTVFDVHRQAGETTVTVVAGRVHVWNVPGEAMRAEPRDGRTPPLLDLAAGQQARISAAGVVAAHARVDTRKAVAWTREEIVFEDEPLAAVVAEFNRYSRQQVRIDEAALGELRVSGTFGIHDEDTFRAFLDSLPDLRAETTGDGIVVRRR